MQILESPASGRTAIETNEVFALRKDDWVAVCNMTFRASQRDTTWELQLFVGTPDNELMAAYCDSQRDVVSLSERWKTNLLAHGWTNSSRENSAP